LIVYYKDKAQHAIVSAAIVIICHRAFFMMGPIAWHNGFVRFFFEHRLGLAVLMAIFWGLFKEILDYKNHGEFSIKDLWADAFGIFIGVLLR